MSPRPSKADHLLATARALFQQHGIRRVTVEEIVRHAGISKATFYAHYANKTAIVRTVIEQLFDEGVAAYQAIVASDQPFPDKINALVDLKEAQTRTFGPAFIDDFLTISDPELLSVVQQRTAEQIERVAAFIRDSQARGDLRADLEPRFVIFLLNHFRELGAHPDLLALYPSSRELTMELTTFFFYGIMGDRHHDRT